MHNPASKRINIRLNTAIAIIHILAGLHIRVMAARATVSRVTLNKVTLNRVTPSEASLSTATRLRMTAAHLLHHK